MALFSFYRSTILFASVLLLLEAPNAFCQVVEDWVGRWYLPGTYLEVMNRQEDGYAVAIDDQGNVFVTGRSIVGGGDYNFVTLKYNTEGVEQWYRMFDGTSTQPLCSQDEPRGIAVDDNGNAYVTGKTRREGEPGSFHYDFVTIKYNGGGVEQWQAHYDGPDHRDDIPADIVVDATGNSYVTGTSFGRSMTIKYNTAGDQLWAATFENPFRSTATAKALAIDGTGNVYVTGQCQGENAYWDYVTAKYTSSGTEVWSRRYTVPEQHRHYPNDIVVDASGNVYVTGQAEDADGDSDYATVKYNSAGVEQWVMKYTGTGFDVFETDVANALVADDAGNVFVAGYSYNEGASADYATVKYNSVGIQQWAEVYNGYENSYDEAVDIGIDDFGDVYVTGYCRWDHGVTPSYDYVTIKYAGQGGQEWLINYDESTYPAVCHDYAKALAIGPNGEVCVTGTGWGPDLQNPTSDDVVTVKYSQPTPTPTPTLTPTTTPAETTPTPTPTVEPTMDPRADVDDDGCVTEDDLWIILRNWHRCEEHH